MPSLVFAQNNQDNSSFITLVNPVRISVYTKDPAKSFASQYSEVSKRNLPASWLFTYDVLENQQVTFLARQMDHRQDLGIFLEVTPNFAKSAAVKYNKTDSWHRSNSVFLSGYSQEDRKKLIDTVFEKFKSDFGYYPKSVGAWWVDSFSLGYMKEKYEMEQPATTTMIASILTGIPIQTRIGGQLTGAGAQQLQWCHQTLNDMGKRKSMMVNVMGRKQKMTREDVEKHLASI